MTDVPQGSPEWFALRLGKVTASRVADVVAKTKSGWGASRARYMSELIIERLTNQPAPSFVNDAMRWGQECEPHARAAYEFLHDTTVELIGFRDHPSIPMSGASPDGILPGNGLIEIKCPSSSTHIETLLGQPIPDEHMKQIHWQMACTGATWCAWVSFDPRLPASMQLVERRVERSSQLVDQLERDVTAFLKELENKVTSLRTQYELKETLKASAA